ncbi:hypothetical protein BB559_001626 [Furculomyces boomerangus]|uniref:Phosphatidic acid phosphatase type 2/haloperoxidase domain-containing protein n=1 Tax=Furculomyces boomerangus TaxID=61424 RepID=A0A2T9Z1A6_9FUNG|nr:hypothetical protein BB559_001626 [Furculomyces boomerangus]
MAGRLRPDFISRCMPDIEKIKQIGGLGTNGALMDPQFGFYNRSICTNPDKWVYIDGMRSFPSGHSAVSFCGTLFLSLYLSSQLRIHDRKGYVYKLVLILMPIIFSVMVAVTRTTDYRHHWEDVIFGGFLGLFVAYFVYYMYFPGLSHPECDAPHNYRIEERDEDTSVGNEQIVQSPDNK